MSEKKPLTPKQKAWIGWIILSVITTAITLTLGVSFPIPPVPSSMPNSLPSEAGDLITLGTTHFTDIEAEDIAVTDDLTVTDAASVGGALAVTGNASVGGATTLTGATTQTGDLTLAGLALFSSTEVTPTAGQYFTPTTTLYIYNSSGAISTTLGACSNTGQLLLTYGADNNNVTINDTNVKTNDGAAQVIGQYDTVTWICVGTTWIELAETAGS